jgi:hypothetical protein
MHKAASHAYGVGWSKLLSNKARLFSKQHHALREKRPWGPSILQRD